jgi:hypothetical protein
VVGVGGILMDLLIHAAVAAKQHHPEGRGGQSEDTAGWQGSVGRHLKTQKVPRRGV